MSVPRFARSDHCVLTETSFDLPSGMPELAQVYQRHLEITLCVQWHTCCLCIQQEDIPGGAGAHCGGFEHSLHVLVISQYPSADSTLTHLLQEPLQ